MSQIPTIKNQFGKYIYKKEHIGAILTMVHNNFDSVEVEGHKITLIERFKADDVCNIVVNIEGIE